MPFKLDSFAPSKGTKHDAVADKNPNGRDDSRNGKGVRSVVVVPVFGAHDIHIAPREAHGWFSGRIRANVRHRLGQVERRYQREQLVDDGGRRLVLQRDNKMCE